MKWMRICLALLALALLGGAARADPIWSYQVLTGDSPLPFQLQPGPAAFPETSAPSPGGIVFFDGGSGNEGSSLARIALGTWAGNLDNTYEGSLPQAAPYRLSLALTDQASGQSGTLTFAGALTGTLSNSSGLANTYTGATSGSLTLGHNRYTVSLEPAPTVGGVLIGIPGNTPQALGTGPATAYADVTVTPATAPEPSSLVLALLGATGGLLAWWRRRGAG